MIYAQFYQRSATNPLDIIEATGDRSVIILDGRRSNTSNGELAASECKKRGYAAWSIHKGETFTRSVRVSQINFVSYDKKIRDNWGLLNLG